MTDELYGLQFDLVTNVMDVTVSVAAAEVADDAWVDAHKVAAERIEQMLADMRNSGTPDIAMIAVAIRQIRLLVSN